MTSRRRDRRRRPSKSAATKELSAEALGAPPSQFSVLLKVLSAALSGGLVVLLIAVIIPALGDFSGVWSAIKSIPLTTLAWFLVVALVIRVLLAGSYNTLMPGLSLTRSLIAREAASAVGNVVPGPSSTATQYVILRSWGVSTDDFAGATITVSLLTNVLVFSAPGALFVVWTLLGMPTSGGYDNVWLIGLIAVGTSVLAIGLVVAVASSERLAAIAGRTGQGLVNPPRRLFRKEPVTDGADRCVALRADTLHRVKDHGTVLLGCIAGSYLLNGVLLVSCLWASGIARSDLALSLGLLLYSVGRIATVISITPGGVGVAEVAYTVVYVAVLGESAHNSVVAGVLLYRALTYLLPMFTGAFCYVLWRIMKRRERHTANQLPVDGLEAADLG